MTDWLVETCAACPMVLQGHAPDGRYVYFRYRYGIVTVEINDAVVYRATHGDRLEGVMDRNKAEHIAETVWRENPEPTPGCPECKRLSNHKMDCSRGR